MNRYVFEINNGRILKNNKIVELTPLENRLLQVLANNEINSMDEIYRYVHPEEKFYHTNLRSITTLKKRLQKKLKLDIKALRGRGYRLENTILINH